MFPARETGYSVSFTTLRSGVRIRVVERGGRGAPPVLFIPGWGSTVYLWHRNLAPVSDAGFRAIAVDLKGAGLSDKPVGEEHYTSDAMTAHIGEILDALELRRPAMVGHSQAASILFRFAERNPERVGAMVLVSPVGHAGVKLLRLYKLLTPRFVRRFLPSLCTRATIELALRRAYGKRGRFSERDVEEFLAPSQFREFAIAQRDALHAFDWKQPLKRKVDVPALLIVGSEDHLVDASDAVFTFQRAIPGLQVRRLEGAGHIIPEEAAEEVNEFLVTFLRGSLRQGYIES